MNQWNVLLAFFFLNLINTLTSALPYQHLVIFEPDEMLLPKETVVATQLQVSPRADGTGDYKFKEVPLTSRKRGKEMIPAEEENDEIKKEIKNTKGKLEATEIWKVEDGEKEKEQEKIKAAAKLMDSADEAAKDAVKEIDEDTKSLSNFEADPQSIKPHKAKQPAVVNDGNPIYITIPIYVNSAPGIPVTFSIGGEQFPLKANRTGAASRRGTLQKAASPTSQYNKLL